MELIPEKIKNIEQIPYKGYLYNLTTASGNLLANNILVRNSGGLGTPPHERLIPGFIHRANGGVLFIDEVANLSKKSQQELLTALQEKKYSITGQSERSSGAMTRSQPVPCFVPGIEINLPNKKIKIDALVEKTMDLYNKDIIKKDGLDILELNKADSIKILVENRKGKIKEESIAMMYRKFYSGKVIRIKFTDGSELVSTPEHPIRTNQGFIKAGDITKETLVKGIEEKRITMIEEVLATYSEENKRIALAYLNWLESAKRATFKQLNVDGKTISAWKKGAIPHAIKALNWLEGKSLLNLNEHDKRARILARMAGVLFGDGNINNRMNKVEFYTDVASLQDIEELKKDFNFVFKDINSCFKIKRTKPRRGEGLILVTYNAFVARYLYALGVPKGDKVRQILKVPLFIAGNKTLEKEFYSSLLASELYAKLSTKSGSKDTATFTLAKIERYEKEHREFLQKIISFLEENQIKTLGIKKENEYIKVRGRGNPEKTHIYVLSISSSYENLKNIIKLNLHYASYKRAKLIEVIKSGKGYLRHVKLLKDAHEELPRLREKGHTIRQIADELKISKNTIWKWVPKSYQSYNQRQKDIVRGLLAKGLNPKEISKGFNIPYPTIIYWKNSGVNKNVQV